MGRPDISFRGVSASSLGLIVTQMPAHVKAAMRTTAYNLPGRDGELHVNEGFGAVDIPVKVSAWDASPTIRQQINAWADGTGKLISSDDTSKCWMASVTDEIIYTRRSHHNGHFYDEAEIVFRCQPYMKEATESTITMTQSGQIANLGDAEALPLIKVTGSGTCVFTIGGETIRLTGVQSGEPVYIDSESGYVYTDDGNAVMEGNFPTIPIGNSQVTITSGVTQLLITPRWRWV